MYDTLAIKAMDALDRHNFSLTRTYFTVDAVASGGLLPDCTPISAAFKVMNALFTAIPDFWFEIDTIAEHRDEVMVEFNWGGRHDRPLKLTWLGLPIFAPTGKRVRVHEVATFMGYQGKLCAVHVTSNADHGLPALLSQVGSYAYATAGVC